jgi:hypothetical protein
MKAIRSWRAWLATGVLAAGALTVLLVTPVSGSSHENALRLHLGSDYQSFSDGTVSQPLTVGDRGCALLDGSLDGPLVTLSANSGRRPGLVDNSIGVKSGGSNGTPCSLTDDREALTIAGSPGVPSWVSLRLDLELKGNAWVVLELFDGDTAAGTFELLTGSSIAAYNAANGTDETPTAGFPYTAESTTADPVAACANPSDSGPDSGPNDNCLWTIVPAVGFDRVVITTEIGAVSLEGSADFGNDPDHDTLLFFNEPPTVNDDAYEFNENSGANAVAAPGVLGNDTDPDGDDLSAVLEAGPAHGTLVLNADGSFTYMPDFGYYGPDSFTYRAADGADVSAPASVSINIVEVICTDETVTDADGAVSGAFTLIASEFACKPYAVTADEGTGVVDFFLGGADVRPFRGYLEFGPQAAPGGVNSQELQYDPDSDGLDYRTVQLCVGPSFDSDGNVLAPTTGTILPPGETWCLASMNSVADATGLLANVYQVYGESDPKFRTG